MPAAEQGDPAYLRLFLDAYAEFGAIEKECFTALIMEAYQDHTAGLRRLLGAKAEFDTANINDYTAVVR